MLKGTWFEREEIATLMDKFFSIGQENNLVVLLDVWVNFLERLERLGLKLKK